MPLKLSEVADMIIPRLDEITAPLLLDLKQYEEYISNVVITGGGARLQGLISYLRQRTPLKVDFGKHYDWLADDTPEQYEAPEYSTLIGTLAMADDYRQNTTNEKPDPTGFIGLLVRIKKTLTNSQQGVIEFLSDNE
jgi:cell division ATPase FtsA